MNDDFREPYDAGSSPLARSLIQAGRQDGPSDHARARAAMAIGIAGAVTTTATVGGAAGTATGTAAASKWLGSIGLVKVLGATVVGSALVVGAAAKPWSAPAARRAPSVDTVASLANAPTHHVPAATTTPAPTPLPAPVEAIAPVTEAAPPAVDVAAPRAQVEHARAPTRAVDHLAPTVTRSAPRGAPVDDDLLRSEVQRLDRARTAIAAGSATTALVDLTTYDRAFPNGDLRDEAEFLRIEALAQSGDTRGARAHADGLLARDPDGPYARRLRALLTPLRADAR